MSENLKADVRAVTGDKRNMTGFIEVRTRYYKKNFISVNNIVKICGNVIFVQEGNSLVSYECYESYEELKQKIKEDSIYSIT